LLHPASPSENTPAILAKTGAAGQPRKAQFSHSIQPVEISVTATRRGVTFHHIIALSFDASALMQTLTAANAALRVASDAIEVTEACLETQ
jgi:hypothetical protein